jgi:hypothetical protein
MYYRVSYFSMLLLSLFSCERSEDQPKPLTIPSVYQKSDAKWVNGLRAFTIHGEIKDSRTLARLLSYDSSYFNYNVNYFFMNWPVLDRLEFVTSTTATVQPSVAYNFSIALEKNLVVLTPNDIGDYCCYYRDVFTRSPYYYLSRYKPKVTEEYVVSSTRGFYSFGFKGNNRVVFSRSGSKFSAPMIQFKIRSAGGQNVGYVNNMLQPDFYKLLEQGDTISIAESEILFERH